MHAHDSNNIFAWTPHPPQAKCNYFPFHAAPGTKNTHIFPGIQAKNELSITRNYRFAKNAGYPTSIIGWESMEFT